MTRTIIQILISIEWDVPDPQFNVDTLEEIIDEKEQYWAYSNMLERFLMVTECFEIMSAGMISDNDNFLYDTTHVDHHLIEENDVVEFVHPIHPDKCV